MDRTAKRVPTGSFHVEPDRRIPLWIQHDPPKAASIDYDPVFLNPSLKTLKHGGPKIMALAIFVHDFDHGWQP
jgi:hypothetical protein